MARAECETGKTRLSVPYRKLPEPERLALARAIVAGELEGFKSISARVAPVRALKRRFRRVASRDISLFVRDVRRLRRFEVGGAAWRYAGVAKRRAPAQLVFVRLRAGAEAHAGGERLRRGGSPPR